MNHILRMLQSLETAVSRCPPNAPSYQTARGKELPKTTVRYRSCSATKSLPARKQSDAQATKLPRSASSATKVIRRTTEASTSRPSAKVSGTPDSPVSRRRGSTTKSQVITAITSTKTPMKKPSLIAKRLA
jgi:hypothetical protein